MKRSKVEDMKRRFEAFKSLGVGWYEEDTPAPDHAFLDQAYTAAQEVVVACGLPTPRVFLGGEADVVELAWDHPTAVIDGSTHPAWVYFRIGMDVKGLCYHGVFPADYVFLRPTTDVVAARAWLTEVMQKR